MLKVANFLRHYLPAEEAAQLIAGHIPRKAKTREIEEAIEAAYGHSLERAACEQPPRHLPSITLIEQVVAERFSGPSMLEELLARSPCPPRMTPTRSFAGSLNPIAFCALRPARPARLPLHWPS
jgi:hypothetical protein